MKRNTLLWIWRFIFLLLIISSIRIFYYRDKSRSNSFQKSSKSPFLKYHHTELSKYPDVSEKQIVSNCQTRIAYIDIGSGSSTSFYDLIHNKSPDDFKLPQNCSHRDVEVFLFEPDMSYLNEMKEIQKDLSFNRDHSGNIVPSKAKTVSVFPGLAVWTEKGIKEFYQSQNQQKAQSSMFLQNSELKSNHLKQKVSTVDLITFLKENFKTEDYIIVNMDTEGSELELIPYWVEQSIEQYINELFVEIHKDFGFPQDKIDAFYDKGRELASKGISVTVIS